MTAGRNEQPPEGAFLPHAAAEPHRATSPADATTAGDLDPAYAGARAMITGGLGLIGSAIARRLVALGAEVLLVDSMIPDYGGNLANIPDIQAMRVMVNIADIRGGSALRHLLAGQDFLFNLAAQTSHLDSMSAPEDDLAINCTAQLQLLEACRAVSGIAIVHAGTRQIYGRPDISRSTSASVAPGRRERGQQDGGRSLSPAVPRCLRASRPALCG